MIDSEIKQNLENRTDINYHVLNALNLVDRTLGELYLQTGYNPFDEDFIINIDYIQKLLENSRDKTPILTEDFLEKPNKEVTKNFTLALENTKKIRTLLEDNIKDGIFKKDVQTEIKDIVIFLKNREQLLAKAIQNLGGKFPNALKEYQNITSINKKLSELIKDSYFQAFRLEIAHQNFVQLCQTNAKLKQLKKEQAKDTIKDKEKISIQQKDQEKTKEKQPEKTQQKEYKTENRNLYSENSRTL